MITKKSLCFAKFPVFSPLFWQNFKISISLVFPVQWGPWVKDMHNNFKGGLIYFIRWVKGWVIMYITTIKSVSLYHYHCITNFLGEYAKYHEGVYRVVDPLHQALSSP